MLWQSVKGSTGVADGSVSPTFDHTLLLPEGHFMLADPMTSPTRNGKARFGTPGNNMKKLIQIFILHF